MTLCPELLAQIEARAERFADESPPLNEAQIAVLRRVFGPRIRAGHGVVPENPPPCPVRTPDQVQNTGSGSRPAKNSPAAGATPNSTKGISA